jgi:hypothetical protein
MGFDWKGIVKTVAPGIATALGGPLAGMGVAAICSALGIENDPQKPDETEARIAQALQVATPETLLALRQADNEFKIAMRKADIDLEKIHADDRDSARKRQMALKDRTPANLAYILTIGFFSVIAAHIFCTIPEENQTLLNIMLGTLGTAWISSMVYFFGSTIGSKGKDSAIVQIASGGKVQ